MDSDPIDLEWEPPEAWPRIRTIDAHTGGEPFRIVTDGFPPIEGETILEKRRYAREYLDHLRTGLLWEPRGHADMYGALLVEPSHPDADVGVLFTHNEGYSTMCGHGIIALGTVLPEAGVVDPDAESLTIETPAGLVTARPEWEAGRVARVAFENVPSFVYAREQTVSVPDVGEVTVDVAFGGAFYAFCNAESVDLSLDASGYRRAIDLGRQIKRAVADALEITHPAEDDLSFLYGTIFTGPPEGDADSRNVCVFADGEVDRCPTGTGVSARLARRRMNGSLEPGEPFVVESIVGSTFTGRVVDDATFEGHDAVIPEVIGSAHVVGRNELLLDPDDPFAEGFFLR
ncbi:proline racemase family protein [Natronobeatus ordinarius]|uniref:proline racemase family protein n=1 Tax=Natronobeatus ordinarius TaxID=2963433 RepID=UPI0020CCAD22|nr:proline racemase family protein [Natronobeatus ordinarius]